MTNELKQQSTIQTTLKCYRKKIEQSIDKLLPPSTTPPRSLHQAMRYSLEAPGKRIRAILLLLGSELYPTHADPLPAAVAIECLHAYSLIHDDLPCMDNSSLRRGRPTCHKQFGEATALLAGDALLTHAFFLLSHHYRHTPTLANDLVRSLSEAAGSQKLIGGQMEDILSEESNACPHRLKFIHENKTGALIAASLTMGARLTNASTEIETQIHEIGRMVGFVFQIVDDILDVTSDTLTLGKTKGLDEANDTLTYPMLYGMEESRKQVKQQTQLAIEKTLAMGGKNEHLLQLIAFMGERIQ